MRRSITLLVLATILAACGDTPLAGIGERSSGWVGVERQPVPVTTPREPVSTALVPASEVRWWNDDLSPSADDGGVSLDDIASRRNPGDRFAQASRNEIAAFFPDLEFPARLPAQVRSVTSQLVLAASEASFEAGHIASFGLWTADPYTQSRSVGQLATIAVFSGAVNDPCAGAGDGCATLRLGERTVGRVVRAAGETVVWSDTDRTYELFVREPAMAAVPAMLESIAPISDLVETPTVEPMPIEQAAPASEPTTVP